MKTTLVLAAGALLGLAEAGIHKMKLQKVPLSKQLVSDGVQLPRSFNNAWTLGVRRHSDAGEGAGSKVHGRPAPSTQRGDVQGDIHPPRQRQSSSTR